MDTAMMKRVSGPSRRAFTLIELLVAVGVIAALAGLILPAIQQAREAARRTQCMNNLHQIGLGLTLFEDAFGHFPAGHLQDKLQIPEDYQQPGAYETDYYFSWLARILPSIEQGPLYERIDFKEWPWQNPSAGLPEGGFINDRVIGLYLCPSYPKWTEPVMLDMGPPFGIVGNAATHYLGVSGTDQFSYDGMLYVNSKVRLVDDGKTNTLLVGERPPPYDHMAGWWLAGSGWYPWFGAADVVLGTEEYIAVNGASTRSSPKSSYGPGKFEFEDDGFGWDKSAWHFWSPHPGGAHFLFADGGRVKFISYGIDKPVFKKLGTRNGGEVINGDF
jgi:prepilin-type N-terminal cleavage/methylation domain-containing protein/prepilin-type processing-associated H-X9-DG protein